MKNKILVIGAAVIDMVVEVDRLPKTGEDIYGDLKETLVGGCGYNVQRILTSFEQPVDFLCPIGKGQYSTVVQEDFKEKGIEVLLVDERMDNGWNLSLVEDDGERSFITLPGIEVQWSSSWFQDIDLNQYRYIYLSGYELEGRSGQVILTALENISHLTDTEIIFDPSPRAEFIDPEILARLFTLKPLVHCNQVELLSLTGATELITGGKQLFKQTANEIIITQGSEGATLYNGAEFIRLIGEKVDVVDTIGAGDAHTGAFIAGKNIGLTSETAGRLANLVSAKIVANATANFEQLDAKELLSKIEQ